MLNNTTEMQLESPHCGKSFGTNKLPSTTNKSPSYIKKKCRENLKEPSETISQLQYVDSITEWK